MMLTKYAAAGFALATVVWVGSSRGTPHKSGNHRPAKTQDHWTWHGNLAAGKTIEIRGVNGTVSAEAATGSDVEVIADKHARRDDPDDVRIEVVESDVGVTICAVYPGTNNRCEPGGGRMNVRNNDVEVDFTVRVPRGVAFEGYTVNGDVEAAALSGPASVATVNGSARLETSSGEAKARTVNGGVTAVVRSLEGTGSLDFETVNGSVTLSLPSGLNANLDAETVNGSITSDFPIQVQGRMTPRRLAGLIGTGGRDLHIRTVNGSVRVRRLP